MLAGSIVVWWVEPLFVRYGHWSSLCRGGGHRETRPLGFWDREAGVWLQAGDWFVGGEYCGLVG